MRWARRRYIGIGSRRMCLCREGEAPKSLRQRLGIVRPTLKCPIKRAGTGKPQYRLRVGEVRVFYDVSKRVVEVLAIVMKADASAWLAKAGERS